jgi:hypothetical protein
MTSTRFSSNSMQIFAESACMQPYLLPTPRSNVSVPDSGDRRLLITDSASLTTTQLLGLTNDLLATSLCTAGTVHVRACGLLGRRGHRGDALLVDAIGTQTLRCLESARRNHTPRSTSSRPSSRFFTHSPLTSHTQILGLVHSNRAVACMHRTRRTPQ